MTDVWYRLEFLHDPDTDDVSAFLFQVGALGLEVQDQTTFTDIPVPDGKVRVVSFFEDGAAQPDLADFGVTDALWGRYDDVSWRETWKKFFKPVRTGSLIFGPPWETFDAPEGGHKIVIEPGMAFGTGTHETTILCAGSLDRVANTQTVHRLLDVGCGSGILSIAAKKMGVEHVTGIDIDPVAVDVARENARINDVDASFETEWPTETYDVVIANILAHILLDLRDDIFERLADDGLLIVSGVTDEQEEDFIDKFLPPTHEIKRREINGEWVMLEIS